jgi:hypothetical protein
MKWKATLKEIFGSLAAVARIVEVTPHAVRTWHNGVPEWHQQKIIDAAKERGFDLTVKQLRSKK